MKFEPADHGATELSLKVAGFLVSRGPWLLAVLAALCAVAFLGARGIELDNRLEIWFPEDSAALQGYRAYKSAFGEDLSLYVVYRDEALQSDARLAILRELTERLREVPYAQTVTSIADVQVRRVLAFGQVPVDLFGEGPIPRDAAMRYAITDPLLRDNLISADGAAVAIEVVLRPLAFSERPDVVAAIDSVLSLPQFSDVDLHVIGGLPILTEMDRLSQGEARLFTSWALLAIYAILAIAFRSPLIAFIPILVAGVSTLLTLGPFVALGGGLNMVTSVLPLVILVLAIADSVHILMRFSHAQRSGDDRAANMRETIAAVLAPCFYTSATTAVALLSFALSDSPPLRAFGAFAALGVVLAFVVAFALVPALLLALPQRIVARLGEEDRLTALVIGTARRLVETRASSIVAVAVVIVAASAVSTSRLEFQTDQINYLRPDNPIRIANTKMQGWFEGVYPLDLVIAHDEAGHFFGLNALRQLDALAGSIRDDPVVHTVISPATYFVSFGRGQLASLDRIGARDGWPANDNAGPFEDFFRSLSDQGRTVISPDGRMAKISVRAEWLDNEDTLALADRLERTLEDSPATENSSWYITGFSMMYVELNQRVIASQIRSLAISVAAIFLMLWLFTRKFRLAALGMVPNVLPVLTTLGLMGLAGIKLDVATILIASISLGVAVDDTIHLLGAFRSAPAELSAKQRATYALKSMGSRIALTTLVLMAGFLMLLGSSFLPLVYFGVFLSLNIALALIYDLLLLPVLLGGFRNSGLRAD